MGEVSERTAEKSAVKMMDVLQKPIVFLFLVSQIFFTRMNAANTSRLLHRFVRPVRINTKETTESTEISILIAVQTPVPHHFPEA